jgi:hypothetical protein
VPEPETAREFAEATGKRLVEYPAPPNARPAPDLVFAMCGQCDSSSTHVPQHLAIGDQEACVDRPMVELLTLLWTAGVHTNESCQGSAGADGRVRAFLSMPAADASAFFRTLLVTGIDEDTFMRISDGWDDPEGWTLSTHLSLGEFEPPEIIEAHLSIDMRFPAEDLPLLVRQFAISA